MSATDKARLPYLREGETIRMAANRMHATLTACAPYLRPGESPSERIQREVADTCALLTLMSKDRLQLATARAALKNLLHECAGGSGGVSARAIDIAMAALEGEV